MSEESRRKKYQATMLMKYGGEEGLREHYREMKRKSMDHPNNQKGKHRGGFSDPEFARIAGSLSRKGEKSKRVDRIRRNRIRDEL